MTEDLQLDFDLEQFYRRRRLTKGRRRRRRSIGPPVATGPPATIGRMTNPLENLDPIVWELGNNQFQMVGLAREIARSRGGATRRLGFDRVDHELALALFRAAFIANEEPPREAESRPVTDDERAFALEFFGPDES